MKRRVITVQQMNRAVDRYATRYESTKTAAAAEGMSYERLRVELRNRGLLRTQSEAAHARMMRRALSDERIQWGLREYARGLSFPQAAMLSGANVNVLAAIAARMNVKRSPKEAARIRFRYPRTRTYRRRADRLSEMRAQYLKMVARARVHDEPMTQARIAAEIGITTRYLRQIVKANGWPGHRA